MALKNDLGSDYFVNVQTLTKGQGASIQDEAAQ
jgi:hypothetical protein